MANGHSEEFKRDAVRIVLASGLTRRQVASDLGIGVSTLNSWIKVTTDSAHNLNVAPNLSSYMDKIKRGNVFIGISNKFAQLILA